MKIIIPRETLPVSRKRTHPHIDVGNGDGPLALPELSHEMPGGDWYDLGYFHSEQVADYAAHAMNLFPKLLAALQAVHSDLDLGTVAGGSTELSIMVDQALAEAGELIHPSAAPAAPAAVKMTVWSGSPCPKDPDNYWIDDVTGERVSALTGERTKGAFAIGDTVRCLCRVVDDCSPDFEKGEIYTVTADSVAEYQRLHAAFEKVDPPTDVKKE